MILFNYEKKFAGNELSFLMSFRKRLEEEIENVEDDEDEKFYLDALEDILDEVEEKLEDKGIK
jgi:hypothetical protein